MGTQTFLRSLLGARRSRSGRAARPRGRRLRPVVVRGSSMLPTVPPGAFVAFTPLERPPRRFEVVVVRPPGRDLEMVKRVVGLPGERVTLTPGGQLLVDGRPVPEPHLATPPHAGPPEDAGAAGAGAGTRPAGPPPGGFELPLGPGQYLVLGDRREASTDGRSFGPVEREDLVGLARAVYWPPRAWRLLGR